MGRGGLAGNDLCVNQNKNFQSKGWDGDYCKSNLMLQGIIKGLRVIVGLMGLVCGVRAIGKVGMSRDGEGIKRWGIYLENVCQHCVVLECPKAKMYLPLPQPTGRTRDIQPGERGKGNGIVLPCTTKMLFFSNKSPLL